MVFPDYYLIDELGRIFAQERRQQVHYSNHMIDLPPNGASTMIRRDLLEKIGGYNENLKAQDGFDLWTRIKKDYKCANVNIPLFYYRRHSSNLTGKTAHILAARRKIKEQASSVDIDRHRPIIAVIPCRKYYDFCNDLWSQKIDGMTLLDIAIQNCIRSQVFDKIVVTSDNRDVQSVLSRYNDIRLEYIYRSTENTIRSRPIIFSLENIVKKIDPGYKGITVLSYIQAPFTKTEILEEAIYTLLVSEADSSMAVEEIREGLFKRTPHGLMQINSKGALTSDFDIVYGETRTTLATMNKNIKKGSLTGSRIVNFVLPKEENFFIHTKRDLEIARLLIKIR
jgi:CMP-N-acetylneuraminic acid synthetase